MQQVRENGEKRTGGPRERPMGMRKNRVLILGGTGMLGHLLLRYLLQTADCDVYATCRCVKEIERYFPSGLAGRFLRDSVDVDDFPTVVQALAAVKPSLVINCIGIIKQLPMANDPLTAITVNAQLPHRIAMACRNANARLIHVSTDCVFDGQKGMYGEDDIASATDLYGRTKLLGEVSYPHCITLRTSMIGHELRSRYGLIEWFLGETGMVRGYRNVIYSGFPTIELARIIHGHVLPNPGLSGVYHVSSEPISKYELLKMVAEKYGKRIDIEPDDDLVLDRSLKSDRFRIFTGYLPPSWPDLIDGMHKDYEANRVLYGR